jgi:hypothetical protein
VNPAPPLPRSGKLQAGGPNALELVWAMLALAAALAIIAASAIAWTALQIEGWLTGVGWDTPLLDMPGALLELAIHRDSSHIAASVEVVAADVAAWRWTPTTVSF